MDTSQPEPPDTGPSRRRRLTLFGAPDNQDQVAVADLLRSVTVGGVLMLIAAVAALLWANLAPGSYETVREFRIGPMSVGHWASDGLLTIFFFVAGLELKREFRAGSLSKPSQALVPIVAAACGMAVPAGLYVALNLGPEGRLEGWAIPMATDIAFALAILAVAAPKLPSSLRAFLLTLAIVDDLGAILVIAVVFTSQVSWLSLGLALGCAVVWFVLQQARLDKWWLHLPLFVACWWFMYDSGVHATIAGVLLGLLTRTSPEEAHDPVDRWEHFWNPISAGLVVPLFALMAAGVHFDLTIAREVFTTPVTLGIVVGLVVGKTIGVTAGAWLTSKVTGAELPADIRWRDIMSLAALAGVGFTVALLVAELAFPNEPDLGDRAKGAVLVASVIAAVLGTILLRSRDRGRVLVGVLD
ncbi:Na+/H+ antiporter NhaA [Propionibacteriaceae bacterium Y2011]